MAEQVIAYDPTTNMELVQDSATGAMTSRKRFNVNASGVRLKYDPTAAWKANESNFKSSRDRWSQEEINSNPDFQARKAFLASQSHSFDPSTGGVSVRAGQIRADIQDPLAQASEVGAYTAPLMGDTKQAFGFGIGSLDQLLDPEFRKQQGFGQLDAGRGEQLQSAKKERQDVLDAALQLNPGYGITRQDIEGILSNTRYGSGFQGRLEQGLALTVRNRNPGPSSAFEGADPWETIGQLGLGFLGGPALGMLGGAGAAFQRERAVKKQRGELDAAVSGAGGGAPLADPMLSFADDIFSKRGAIGRGRRSPMNSGIRFGGY